MEGMTFGTIILGALALLVIIVVIRGFKIVQQAESMVIERLGEYHRTLSPGINIIVPFFDVPRPVARRRYMGDVSLVEQATLIDMREALLDFPAQSAVTKDNVTVTVNGALYYQIVDPKQAVYAVDNLVLAIEVLAKTSLRNEIGKMDLDTLFESRDQINAALEAVLDQAGNKWGVKVTRVEIQDIDFPTEVEDAMRQQMIAEREKRAQILRAEGHREAAIREAEGERQAAIERAEGDKQAAILQAAGQQEAIDTILRAGAERLQPKDVISYLVALEYMKTLPDIAKNGERVFLPYEASGLLSSVGSIGDLLGGKPIAPVTPASQG
ncbi:MAG: SPFH domain-containing protein [Gammaproteobacteria bacterium]|nr:SPFH domain-containing protein [Gammaproteobacteria bacterium]